MARKNQGGSILNFVIIGVVLALLLIGGAYFVRSNTKLTVDKTSSPAPTKVDAPKPSANKESTAPSNSPPSTDKTPNTPVPSGPTAPSTPEASNKLPQTGPAETLTTIFGLGLITYIAAAYIRSRRTRSSTL